MLIRLRVYHGGLLVHVVASDERLKMLHIVALAFFLSIRLVKLALQLLIVLL